MQEAQLKTLLDKLTMDEKIAQLVQLYGGFIVDNVREVVTGPLSEMKLDEEIIRNMGSVLNSVGAELIIQIQNASLERSSHKIPVAVMADICFGYKTILPIPLGQGAAWEPELIEEGSRMAAREASAAGVMITYSPMVDLVRDARWGRVSETAGGEDPYLGALYARAYVKGYQGDGVENDPEAVAACVKHFAGYGASEAGRDYNTVDMSERALRQYYLPNYKAAVDAGCEMAMTSFNFYDGVPASANTFLMRDILRGEWGFDGVLVSDFGAVAEIMVHSAAADLREAAEKGIKAGVDIDMMTGAYANHLKSLIAEGQISEALLDEAVLRLLRLKNKLGLFEKPLRSADPEKEKRICLSPEHRAVARKMVAKSCVLLQNNNDALPLNRDVQTVALIGPFSGTPEISGSWSLFAQDSDTVTLYDGIKAKAPGVKLLSAMGCVLPGVEGKDMPFDAETEWRKAVEAAQSADIIVLTLGESGSQSGEGGSRGDITLPPEQLRLLDAVAGMGKKTIVVLFNGRPLDLRALQGKADAILVAWLPGTEGGNGIADVLFGDENPAARLTMSFPYAVGQCPVYYNHYRTGRPFDGTRYSTAYQDMPNEPLFPFGYGLSYTHFEYGEIQLDQSELTRDSVITAHVSVTNTGELAGSEVIQLYLADVAASVVRPVKELKGFQKLYFQPGEEKIITFEINEEMLRFWDINMCYTSEPGRFKLYIGGNSRDVKESEFTLVL